MEPFLEGSASFTHGITFGGHPVQCAIALKNIEIMQREGIVEHVREHEDAFRSTLAQLLDLPIVGDLRGTGFFYALELVKDKETRETFSRRGVARRSCAGSSRARLFERGLICRADDRGDPVVQISPPLIAGPAEFDEIAGHPRRRARRGLGEHTRAGSAGRRPPARPASPRRRPARLDADPGRLGGGRALRLVARRGRRGHERPLRRPRWSWCSSSGSRSRRRRNRRMRTTGRLLLILLAVVFATASVVAGLGWVTAVGLALSAATGLLALFELLPDLRRA